MIVLNLLREHIIRYLNDLLNLFRLNEQKETHIVS